MANIKNVRLEIEDDSRDFTVGQLVEFLSSLPQDSIVSWSATTEGHRLLFVCAPLQRGVVYVCESTDAA